MKTPVKFGSLDHKKNFKKKGKKSPNFFLKKKNRLFFADIFQLILHCSTHCLTLDFFINIFSPNRYIVDMIEIFSKFPSHRSIIGAQYCVKHHRRSIYWQYFTDKNRNFNPYFILLFAIWTTFSHMTSLKIERTFFNLSSLSF